MSFLINSILQLSGESGPSSDEGENVQVVSSSDSDSDIESTSSSTTTTTVMGRDGTQWRPYLLNNHVVAQNIVRRRSGPTVFATQRITSLPITAFQLMFSNEMLNHIRLCTVAEANRQLNSNDWELSITELKRFMGLVISRGEDLCKVES